MVAEGELRSTFFWSENLRCFMVIITFAFPDRAIDIGNQKVDLIFDIHYFLAQGTHCLGVQIVLQIQDIIPDIYIKVFSRLIKFKLIIS